VLDNYVDLRPDFLKIDIEGAEIDALESAQKLLEHRPNVYVEVHTTFFERFGRRVEEIFELLPLNDYYCYAMNGIDRHGKRSGICESNGEYHPDEHFALFLCREPVVRR